MLCRILKAIIILSAVRSSKSYQYHNDHTSIPVVDVKLYIVYLIVRCVFLLNGGIHHCDKDPISSTIPWEGWQSGASFLNKDNDQLQNVFKVEFKFRFSSFLNSIHFYHKWFKWWMNYRRCCWIKKVYRILYSSFPIVMMTMFSPSWPLIIGNVSTVQISQLKETIPYPIHLNNY
jgi:hypothetical protein